MIGRLKCRLGLHTGYPESAGGVRYFYCTRCESYRWPMEVDTDV